MKRCSSDSALVMKKAKVISLLKTEVNYLLTHISEQGRMIASLRAREQLKGVELVEKEEELEELKEELEEKLQMGDEITGLKNEVLEKEEIAQRSLDLAASLIDIARRAVDRMKY